MNKHDGDLKYWKGEAIRLLSLYVRQIHQDEDGYVKCFTCDTVLPWRRMEDGHFCSRVNLSTFFLMENNHPQCHHCNCVLKGNLKVYAENLNIRYYPGKAEELRILSKKSEKLTWTDFKEIAEMFKNSLKRNSFSLR